MARYSLSALGADKPGIVAAVSGALVDLGCNLEDSTMTILQGHFAILLVVATPATVGSDELEQALDPVAAMFDLTFAVRLMSEDHAPVAAAASDMAPAPIPETGDPWTVSVHGADRAGIVHAVTTALAEAGGNVVDLATHLVGEKDSPVYVMTIRALLPPGRDGEVAAERVLSAARELGVHCNVHRDEADLL
ncbi:MAG: glycine cleavage system protein R [Acidimicrobiales bacterium]